jgi:two-component system response regulator
MSSAMINSQSTILLVEDNANDLELALHGLTRGMLASRVDVARDGAEALDYIFCRGDFANRNPADLPRVVLLDIKLPMIDGIDVLKAIRADPKTHALPVVMLTSSAEDRDLKSCYDLGVNSYIVKPVDIDQFFAAIQQVGMYWLVLNRQGER